MVGGIIDGTAQKIIYEKAKITTLSWDKKYPDWDDKFCYIIFFRNPVNSMSIDDIKSAFGDKYSDEWMEEYYQKQNKVVLMTVPEDELLNCYIYKNKEKEELEKKSKHPYYIEASLN